MTFTIGHALTGRIRVATTAQDQRFEARPFDPTFLNDGVVTSGIDELMQSSDADLSVVLVDTNDRELGLFPKLAAHREGRLHRAVSVFIFDKQDRLLLQRRAAVKYHSGGLWSNTCCTHPLPGQSPQHAAAKRLDEEMGFTCDLQAAGNFIYRAEFGNGLIEYEFDHLFRGHFDGQPHPNPAEVCDWRWITPGDLERDQQERPEEYTAWFWLGRKAMQNAPG